MYNGYPAQLRTLQLRASITVENGCVYGDHWFHNVNWKLLEVSLKLSCKTYPQVLDPTKTSTLISDSSGLCAWEFRRTF
ncbi:hypothetical protein L6452_41471 [Arctium lappa]|uniref:Uncharacterized protein n=1 Tax=Arctium lappa TaxID=4217 RepID=A0ACB8XPJ8_ARCLA|nr:hypothetical protein L6452_41471 [Arctium lappa]